MCGPCVVCGKCGNNACNAGYGTLPDGSECDACQSAYETQNRDFMKNWRRRWWLRLQYVKAWGRVLQPHYIGWLFWRWRGMPEPRPWYTFRR